LLPSLVGILALAFIVPVAAAAVPHDTAYQGSLTDDLGDPLVGPVDIDFAVYEAMVEIPGEVALYSEEHSGVELDSDGSFNVLIGTGTVIEGTYDPSLFQEANRYLQVTINGEILEPRQPISAVPFALVAEEIQGAPDLVTQVQTIENQVGDLPPGATTIATHIQNLEAAVEAADTAASTAQSAADAVAADLAVSDVEQAVLIASLGPAPYASAVLRAGSFASLQAAESSPGPLVAAITVPSGDWNQFFFIRCHDEYCQTSTQTEVAIGDFDPFGECVSFNMDGSCAWWGPVFNDLTDMSLAIGSDGLPILVFAHPWTSSLAFIQCGNQDCNAGTHESFGFPGTWSGNESNLIGGASDLVDNVLGVGGDGFPVIASFSGTDMILTHCSDLTCSVTTQVTLASLIGTHAELSMKIGANGFPAIAYYDSTDDDLVFIRCADATCSSNSVTVLDSVGNVGSATSLAIDSLGRPSIAYKDSTNNTLKFVRCLNSTCTSTSAATVVLAGATSLNSSDVTYTAEGDAVISYIQSNALSYLTCLDFSCSTSETTSIAASSVIAGSERSMDMLLSSSDKLICGYMDSSGIEIYAQTGSRIDAIHALIATAQASADAILGSCGTLAATTSCPLGTAADGPRCDTIPVGSFCEGDGECGTDALLNNCGSFDWYLRTGN
jgi:hypothetical protein